MYKFEFSKPEYEEIKEKLMLDDDSELSKILELRIKGYSISQIAIKLNMSERTVSRRVKELRKKVMKVI